MKVLIIQWGSFNTKTLNVKILLIRNNTKYVRILLRSTWNSLNKKKFHFLQLRVIRFLLCLCILWRLIWNFFNKKNGFLQFRVFHFLLYLRILWRLICNFLTNKYFISFILIFFLFPCIYVFYDVWHHIIFIWKNISVSSVLC